MAHASSMTLIHTRQPGGRVTLPAQGAHQPGLRSLTLFYTDSDVREVLMNVLEEPELGRCQKCPGHNFPYLSPCSGETHPWEHPLHEASQPLRLFSLPASSRAEQSRIRRSARLQGSHLLRGLSSHLHVNPARHRTWVFLSHTGPAAWVPEADTVGTEASRLT